LGSNGAEILYKSYGRSKAGQKDIFLDHGAL
jgi:hypothetical protein